MRSYIERSRPNYLGSLGPLGTASLPHRDKPSNPPRSAAFTARLKVELKASISQRPPFADEFSRLAVAGWSLVTNSCPESRPVPSWTTLGRWLLLESPHGKHAVGSPRPNEHPELVRGLPHADCPLRVGSPQGISDANRADRTLVDAILTAKLRERRDLSANGRRADHHDQEDDDSKPVHGSPL